MLIRILIVVKWTFICFDRIFMFIPLDRVFLLASFSNNRYLIHLSIKDKLSLFWSKCFLKFLGSSKDFSYFFYNNYTNIQKFSFEDNFHFIDKISIFVVNDSHLFCTFLSNRTNVFLQINDFPKKFIKQVYSQFILF